MELIDTHCHIHEVLSAHMGEGSAHARWQKAGITDPAVLVARAHAADVSRLICVGTSLEDSQQAVEFVQSRDNTWASIGIHPHEAKDYAGKPNLLQQFASLATQPKVVAVGECGLDYYYNHSPREDQEAVLRFQIELAISHNLPLIFHIRDAFDEFWPIFDTYRGIRGIVHSFSATTKELEQALKRGLFIGVNGIMTFTRDPAQLAAARAIPLDKMVLETDAPFLTPTPYRGTICEPAHVRVVASFLSELRNEPFQELAAATTHNALTVFKIR